MTNTDIITQVLADEGGGIYTVRPDDPGGATKWGITIPALADWWRATGVPGNPTATNISAIDEPAARAFYAWLMDHSGIGKITNDTLRYFVFDAAVNLGTSQAVKLLQRSLGVHDDGVIGPVTLAATPYLDSSKLCRLFGIEQMLFYSQIQPATVLAANIHGWLNRLARKMRTVS